MPHNQVVIAILLMALVILFTRALPFLFFRRREPPEMLHYLERNIPPLIMVLLVMYCLRGVKWVSAPYGIPEIAGIGVVVMAHLWRRNALLSIVSGTVVYMLTSRIAGSL